MKNQELITMAFAAAMLIGVPASYEPENREIFIGQSKISFFEGEDGNVRVWNGRRYVARYDEICFTVDRTVDAAVR